jgi:predicted ATP-grasp superfamily ATP-dependent carboligase
MRPRTLPIASSFDFDGALRRLRPERSPALLLGGGLNLIRPLGFAGIPAIVATPDPRDSTLASRFCSGRCLLPLPHHPEALVETLLTAGDRLASALGCRVPLFYGNDDYLNLIYSFREQLAQRFLLLLNEPDVARALLDKDRFEAFARDRGLAVPRTLTWDDTGPDALDRAAGPVLVKPRMKVGWDDSTIHLRLFGGESKARIFESGREAMAHPLVCQFRDQLSFQEFIRGDDRHLWSFHGVADEKGTLLAWFIGRKLRTFPSLTGMSTYLELAHDDELAAVGRDIVARIPLKGVFKIDFKKDATSGLFYMLEINARFNLWHHVAARNGLNLPQIAYDYLVHGARPPETPYCTAFRWLCFRHDFHAYRELASRGELSLGGWLFSLLASRKVYHLFSWTDPLPCLMVAGSRVQLWLRRGLDYLRLRLRQWLSTAL